MRWSLQRAQNDAWFIGLLLVEHSECLILLSIYQNNVNIKIIEKYPEKTELHIWKQF